MLCKSLYHLSVYWCVHCCWCIMMLLLPRWGAFMLKHYNKYPLQWMLCVCWMFVVYLIIFYEVRVYSINNKQIKFLRNVSVCTLALRLRLIFLVHSFRCHVISTILLLLFLFPFLFYFCRLLFAARLSLFYPSTGNDTKLLFAFLFLFPMSTQYFTYGRALRQIYSYTLNQNSLYQIKVIDISLSLTHTRA